MEDHGEGQETAVLALGGKLENRACSAGRKCFGVT